MSAPDTHRRDARDAARLFLAGLAACAVCVAAVRAAGTRWDVPLALVAFGFASWLLWTERRAA